MEPVRCCLDAHGNGTTAGDGEIVKKWEKSSRLMSGHATSDESRLYRLSSYCLPSASCFGHEGDRLSSNNHRCSWLLDLSVPKSPTTTSFGDSLWKGFVQQGSACRTWLGLGATFATLASFLVTPIIADDGSRDFIASAATWAAWGGTIGCFAGSITWTFTRLLDNVQTLRDLGSKGR